MLEGSIRPFRLRHKIRGTDGMIGAPLSTGLSEPLYTFCIVTTSSSKQLSFLHDRMPVVLSSQDDIELWLGPSDWSKDLARLIRPCEDIRFEWLVQWLE
jgi:putative SOS response-associated peptidase YedK